MNRIQNVWKNIRYLDDTSKNYENKFVGALYIFFLFFYYYPSIEKNYNFFLENYKLSFITILNSIPFWIVRNSSFFFILKQRRRKVIIRDLS